MTKSEQRRERRCCVSFSDNLTRSCDIPVIERMEKSQWQLHMLPQLRVEMEQLGLLSPMLWVPVETAADVCYDKLIDMLYFAPSDWDTLMGSLTTLTRNVLMGKLNYEAAIKALGSCRDFLSESTESLIRRYWLAIKHLVDCTWVLLTCLHRGRSVLAVLPGVLGGLVGTRDMSLQQQSALAASKSITLQLCHYAQWPSLMDERGPLFRGAVDAAALALKLHPNEGVWITLYARCLSWRHPDKAVMLHGAARLAHTPFTVVELATLLAMSSNSKAVELAAQLITQAVAEWSANIYVNTSYVTLLLTSNCRSLLSLEVAEECLRRARALAPDSPLLSGYFWSLHDIRRAGGQLSPILEEASQDEDVFGRWDEDKEKRLRRIAAKLYPGAGAPVAADVKQRVLAQPAGQPEGQALPNGDAVEDQPDLAARSRTLLWGPMAPRRAARKSSSPPPPPPPDTATASPSSSPPTSRRLRTVVPVATLRMPRSSPTSFTKSTAAAAPSTTTSAAPSTTTSAAPSTATSTALSMTASAAASSMTATAAAPSAATSTAPSTATSTAPSTATSAAPSSARMPPPSSVAARLYVSVPSSPPQFRSRFDVPTRAVAPTPAATALASTTVPKATRSVAPSVVAAARALVFTPVSSASLVAPTPVASATCAVVPTPVVSASRVVAPTPVASATCAGVPTPVAAPSRAVAASSVAAASRAVAHSVAAPTCAVVPTPVAAPRAVAAPFVAAATCDIVSTPNGVTCSVASTYSLTATHSEVTAPVAASTSSRIKPFSPPTPPPTPSPPKERSQRATSSLAGKTNQDSHYSVPLWRRTSGVAAAEKTTTSWREAPEAKKLKRWSAPAPCQTVLDDETQPLVNCACSGACALQTFRNYRTLRPPQSAPKICSLKIK